ncbi:MAG: DMT family transporter [Patescibacteria group bacterium]
MKNILKYGSLLIIAAAVLWGIDGVLRRSLYSISPIVIVFYEHLIGAAIILPVFLKDKNRSGLTKKEWLAIIFVAFLSGVLGTLWFTTALLKVNFIPFSVVFLIQKLQPLFAIGSAAILLREKVDRRYIGWAVLSLAAAYFVTFKNGIVNFETGEGTIIAALFALGAAFAWGSSTAFSRYALLAHSNTQITALRFFITVPIALIFVFAMGQAPGLGSLTGSQFFRLFIIALTTGMVALWIYYKGLKNTHVKISAILELAFPLTAVLIDIFLYKTILAPTQYIAAVVLLFAIYKVSVLNNENNVRQEV